MKDHLKFAAIALLLLLLRLSLFAQTVDNRHLIDSLRNTLDTIKEDSDWVDRHIQICSEERKSDLANAETCLKDALEDVRQRGYQKGEIRFLLRLGSIYDLKGRYSEEMEVYLEALGISESTGDSSDIASCYNSLGNLYNSLSDFDIALEYHFKALDLRIALGEESLVAGTYNNIGNTYLSKEQFAEALPYYQKAEAINLRLDKKTFLSINLSNLGLTYDGMGESQKAIGYHEKALALRLELGNEISIASSKIYMGFAYTHLGQHDKAIELLEEGMIVAKENSALSLMERGYAGLYEAWKAKGQFQKSLAAHESYLELRDSIRNDEVAGKVARAQMQLQSERKQREAELIAQNMAIKAEAVRERESVVYSLVIAGVGVLLIIVLLIAIFFALRYRTKKRSEAILEARVVERTLAMQEANQELSKFIYQSSHDMRSPLTSIKGLVSIALNEKEAGNERQYIDLIMDRVNHLDGVYTSLIEFMNVKERVPVVAPLDLKKVQVAVLAAIAEKRGGFPLDVQFDFSDQHPVEADEFLLGAILQNLLLNAIDFRDAAKNATCTVRLFEMGDHWELQVQDNGIGLPPDFLPRAFDMFIRGNNKSRGSGLGLYTAQLAARKMDGDLELESILGAGTVARLRFPKQVRAVH